MKGLGIMIDKFTGENLEIERAITGEGDNEKEVITLKHLDTGKVDTLTFQEWAEVYDVVLMMETVIQRQRSNPSPIHLTMPMGGFGSDDAS